MPKLRETNDKTSVENIYSNIPDCEISYERNSKPKVKILENEEENKTFRVDDWTKERSSRISRLSKTRICCIISALLALIILLIYNTIATSVILYGQHHQHDDTVINVSVKSIFNNKIVQLEQQMEELKQLLNNSSVDNQNSPHRENVQQKQHNVELKLAKNQPTEEQNKTKNESKHLPSIEFVGLILKSKNQLELFDPKTANHKILYETKKVIYDFDFFADSIFYAGYFPSTLQQITNEYFNATHLQSNTLFDDPRVKPRGLAADHLTGNLYFVDESMGALIVINIYTKNVTLLLTSLKNPQKIVLDPMEGAVFILQRSKEVVRVLINDNSYNQTTIGRSDTQITLDRQAKRVYWVENKVTIVRSDYDGKNRRNIFIDTESIASLTIFEGKLYWLWPKGARDSAVLWSCRITADDCEGRDKQLLPGDPISVKARLHHSEISSNPCSIDNGGCQYVCLISSKGERSCACNLGYRLKSDSTSCEVINDFMILVVGNKIRGLDLYRNDSIYVFWPVTFRNASTLYKEKMNFDYDLLNDDLYLSYDYRIDKMKLKSYSEQKTVLKSDQFDFVYGEVAYDWSTRNLYYFKRSKTTRFPHSLMVTNTKGNFAYQRTLSSYKFLNGYYYQLCPFNLLVYPNTNSLLYYLNGYLVQQNTVKDSKRLTYSIDRIFLAVDYAENKLYRVAGTRNRPPEIYVRYSEFNVNDEKQISVAGGIDISFIYVYNEWVYLVNPQKIWRANKLTGTEVSPMNLGYSNGTIVYAKLISSTVQSVDEKTDDCLIGNGGCEQFCFTGNKTTHCDCDDSKQLHADGISCF